MARLNLLLQLFTICSIILHILGYAAERQITCHLLDKSQRLTLQTSEGTRCVYRKDGEVQLGSCKTKLNKGHQWSRVGKREFLLKCQENESLCLNFQDTAFTLTSCENGSDVVWKYDNRKLQNGKVILSAGHCYIPAGTASENPGCNLITDGNTTYAFAFLVRGISTYHCIDNVGRILNKTITRNKLDVSQCHKRRTIRSAEVAPTNKTAAGSTATTSTAPGQSTLATSTTKSKSTPTPPLTTKSKSTPTPPSTTKSKSTPTPPSTTKTIVSSLSTTSKANQIGIITASTSQTIHPTVGTNASAAITTTVSGSGTTTSITTSSAVATTGKSVAQTSSTSETSTMSVTNSPSPEWTTGIQDVTTKPIRPPSQCCVESFEVTFGGSKTYTCSFFLITLLNLACFDILST